MTRVERDQLREASAVQLTNIVLSDNSESQMHNQKT